MEFVHYKNLYTAVPGPVSKLSALPNNSNSIFVSWDRPINSPFCVRKYEVIYCCETFVCTTIFTQVNSIIFHYSLLQLL